MEMVSGLDLTRGTFLPIIRALQYSPQDKIPLRLFICNT